MRWLLMSVLWAVLGSSTFGATQAAAEPAGSDATDERSVARLVTFVASSTDRVGGERLVLRGKVRTERGVKRLVQLHVKVLGEWDVVGHTRTTRTGAYRFVLTSPNPAASQVRLDFRVEAVGTASRKLRAAWRTHSRSTSTRITFRNNPAIPQQTYSLADPVACDSGTPGVMARTAACVAAVEAQFVERTWLDVRLMSERERDTDLRVQLGVDLQVLAPQELDPAYLHLLLPHTGDALLESDVPSGDALMTAIFALLWVGDAVADELESFDAGAENAATWKPAWTDHFIAKDLSEIVVSGDTATTPERTFSGAGAGSLTLGGAWKYVAGRWYSAVDPATVVENLR